VPEPDSEAWARIEALVDELLDLNSDERSDALQRAREDDPAVAEAAERLLGAMEDGEESLLDSPLFVSSPELMADATEDAARDRSGTLLGPYRLVRVLGRGGMGVVYLAERADEEFEKQVAVKLMPRGLESEEAVRRFRLERQVLARLDHPHIARLLDGGVTDEGYPYLVMELVEGQPIDLYCDENRLGMEARLGLFRDICAAVQHAHQNLVVHRDLKPGNILVTEEGSVRLLDFGVAKLLDDDLEADSLTRFQPRTTAYASPEQLANQPVSTASDVYSLGVVLYRLLTGERPRDRGGSSDEARDGAAAGPTRPTLRPSEVAERVATEGGDLPWRRRLAGDLDRIVLKALAEEPRERYAAASALGEDLQRFLAGLPVSAREPTLAYRLRKFVSRHRTGVVASLLAALALTLALVAALWQAGRARAEARRAEQVASLLSGLFADANPWAPTSGEVTVPELLDRGVERVRTELEEDPATRSRLLDVLGRAYNGQGLEESGIPLLEEVLAERRMRLGDRHPETAGSMRTLGLALAAAGRVEEGAPLVEGAFALSEELYGRDSPETADYLFALGSLRHEERNYEEQEQIFRRLVGNLRRQGEERSSRLALALGELSIALDLLDRDAESLEIQRQALEMAEATLGPAHPYTATLRNNMGLRLVEAGDLEAAATYLRLALESFESRPGLNEEELVAPLSNVGRVLTSLGDFPAARPYVERAAEIGRRLHPPNHFTRIGAEINLATVLYELGELEEAAEIYGAALSRFEAMLGAGHQATARARSLLGATLARLGQTAAAEPALVQALGVQRSGLGDPMFPDETLVALGRLRLDAGRLDESEALLAEALALRRETLADGHWRLAEIQIELAALAQARGNPDPALAEASRRTLAETLPEGNFRLERARRFFGDPL
jgi:eukaryotic-like serine/threonine-protein kinase